MNKTPVDYVYFFSAGLSCAIIVRPKVFIKGFWFLTFILKYVSNYSFKSRFSVA